MVKTNSTGHPVSSSLTGFCRCGKLCFLHQLAQFGKRAVHRHHHLLAYLLVMRFLFGSLQAFPCIHSLPQRIAHLDHILHHPADIIGVLPIRQTVQTVGNHRKCQIVNVFLQSSNTCHTCSVLNFSPKVGILFQCGCFSEDFFQSHLAICRTISSKDGHSPVDCDLIKAYNSSAFCISPACI